MSRKYRTFQVDLTIQALRADSSDEVVDAIVRLLDAKVIRMKDGRELDLAVLEIEATSTVTRGYHADKRARPVRRRGTRILRLRRDDLRRR